MFIYKYTTIFGWRGPRKPVLRPANQTGRASAVRGPENSQITKLRQQCIKLLPKVEWTENHLAGASSAGSSHG